MDVKPVIGGLTSIAGALTAVIVNWRTPDLSARAAQALIDDGVAPERVVVVDNGSGDDSAARLLAALPGSVVKTLPGNEGYARASNAGARELPADQAYLFVNSDAFVHRPGSVAALLAALHDPAVGAATPRLLAEDLTTTPSVYPLSTPLPSAIRAAGLSRFVPDPLAPRLGAHWSHDRSRPIDYAIGAVLLVRAAAWEQLGGFDETISMYAEDQDLYWRLKRLGWRSQFVAEADFVHVGGVSSSKLWDATARAKRLAEAEAATVHKHLAKPRAEVTTGLMAAGATARALRSGAKGERKLAREHIAWARGYLKRPPGNPPGSRPPASS